MKQKILLSWVVGLLITIPALAGPEDPTGVAGVSDLGSNVHVEFGDEFPNGYISSAENDVLRLTVDVAIRSKPGATPTSPGIIAYIYKLTLTNLTAPAGSQDVAVTSFALAPNLFTTPDATNLHSYGWIGGSSPFDPSFELDYTGFFLTFLFPAFTAAPGADSMLFIYATAELLPSENDLANRPPKFDPTQFYFETGTGNSELPFNFTNDGLTLGPSLDGGGASFHYVPEASSLLLLTFGLLSGGVLRSRISHNFKGTRK